MLLKAPRVDQNFVGMATNPCPELSEGTLLLDQNLQFGRSETGSTLDRVAMDLSLGHAVSLNVQSVDERWMGSNDSSDCFADTRPIGTGVFPAQWGDLWSFHVEGIIRREATPPVGRAPDSPALIGIWSLGAAEECAARLPDGAPGGSDRLIEGRQHEGIVCTLPYVPRHPPPYERMLSLPMSARMTGAGIHCVARVLGRRLCPAQG